MFIQILGTGDTIMTRHIEAHTLHADGTCSLRMVSGVEYRIEADANDVMTALIRNEPGTFAGRRASAPTRRGKNTG